MKWVFWVSAMVIAYAYVGYPLLVVGAELVVAAAGDARYGDAAGFSGDGRAQ